MLEGPEKPITKEKEPHFISTRLLEALGGIKEDTPVGPLVNKGAYLWGAEDREKGAGIFRHVMLVSRVAYVLAEELKKKSRRFANLDLRTVVETAILHDIPKLYAQDREKVPPHLRKSAGIRPDFSESDIETEETAARWLKELGFSDAVCEAIKDHFPQEVIDDPYWQVVLVGDFMASQKIMPVDERLDDVEERWITQPVAKGEEPKIDPELFKRAREVITQVAVELFSILETTDEEFIDSHDLNNPDTAQRWERFLNQTREKGQEESAKQHVRHFIGLV